MNKRYMDFVPKNNKGATKQPKMQAVMPKDVPPEAKVASNVKAKRTTRLSSADVLGRGLIDAATRRTRKPQIRNNDKVKTDIPKEVTKVELENKVVAKANVAESEKMKIPQTRFVNTEKVAKRPLSKNVYQKKIVVPKEEPQGPVTIIHKPEKDSKVGLIVTIIITIILGAAAGTVAFLLIPK